MQAEWSYGRPRKFGKMEITTSLSNLFWLSIRLGISAAVIYICQAFPDSKQLSVTKCSVKSSRNWTDPVLDFDELTVSLKDLFEPSGEVKFHRITRQLDIILSTQIHSDIPYQSTLNQLTSPTYGQFNDHTYGQLNDHTYGQLNDHSRLWCDHHWQYRCQCTVVLYQRCVVFHRDTFHLPSRLQSPYPAINVARPFNVLFIVLLYYYYYYYY